MLVPLSELPSTKYCIARKLLWPQPSRHRDLSTPVNVKWWLEVYHGKLRNYLFPVILFKKSPQTIVVEYFQVTLDIERMCNLQKQKYTISDSISYTIFLDHIFTYIFQKILLNTMLIQGYNNFCYVCSKSQQTFCNQ